MHVLILHHILSLRLLGVLSPMTGGVLLDIVNPLPADCAAPLANAYAICCVIALVPFLLHSLLPMNLVPISSYWEFSSIHLVLPHIDCVIHILIIMCSPLLILYCRLKIFGRMALSSLDIPSGLCQLALALSVRMVHVGSQAQFTF